MTGLRTLEYPPEAIWEIVVNAIIHRDYSISDDVQIRIFDNRVEIISPGKLPGYVSVENILEARYSRNSKVVRNLARYPSPPDLPRFTQPVIIEDFRTSANSLGVR
jgi:ATP-dependent DNA helicase RecG